MKHDVSFEVHGQKFSGALLKMQAPLVANAVSAAHYGRFIQ